MKAEKIANAPAKIAQIAQRNSVRVGRSEQGANACAYDSRNGQALLLEYFQNSQVCKASGESAAQRKSDSKSIISTGRNARLQSVVGLPIGAGLGNAERWHETSLRMRDEQNNEADVPVVKYSRTLY